MAPSCTFEHRPPLCSRRFDRSPARRAMGGQEDGQDGKEVAIDVGEVAESDECSL